LSMSSMDHSLACTRKDDAYPMEGVMDRHLLKHKKLRFSILKKQLSGN
jgi:hypothetical protein